MSWYKSVIDQSAWGILVYKKESYELVYANNYAKEVLSLKEEGCQIDNLIPDPVRPNIIYLNKATLDGEGFYSEICLKKMSGELLYAELSTQHVPEDDILQAIMFKDITYQLKLRRELLTKQEEITKTYEEMLRQNEELKVLDKAKDKFIALISHELRTPLSAMVATSEVLNMNLVDSEEQKSEFIQTIYDQGQYLLEIVNDILDFAKIRSGKVDLYVNHMDLQDLIKECVTQFTNFAKEKSVTIKTNTDDEFLCYYDQTRLKQVISNVLNNAIKFTRANTQISLDISQDDSFVTLEIKDQGDGIPEDKLSAVFDEFVTLQNINTHQKGTGLGMPISKKLIDLMGGSIAIDTSYKEGANFVIKIPNQRVLTEDVYREKLDGEIDLTKIA